MNSGPVLYAEDEPHDVLFLKRVFKLAEIPNNLLAVENGEQAIDLLTDCVNNRKPLPALVLLDLNMPFKNGIEVLQWIRSQQSLCGLPVVVLSSSNQDSDIIRAYANGVNGYLVKPGSLKELESLARALKDFWLTHNRAATDLNRTPAS